MKPSAEINVRKLSWTIAVVEFVCVGVGMQFLLGGSLEQGVGGLLTHAPGMWLLAALISLISAEHIYRLLHKRMSS
jgi:hypothetical protein